MYVCMYVCTSIGIEALAKSWLCNCAGCIDME